MNNVGNIANIIFGSALLFVWGTGIVIILVGIILGKMYERSFFHAVKECISVKEIDLQKCVESIRNYYAVYRNHRFGFAGKKIVHICQELSLDIRRGVRLDSLEYKSKDEWADRLDEIIKQFQYEEHFSDEKANEIVDELNSKISTEMLNKIKQKLIFLEAFHKGVISVKDVEIQELKDKLKRKQWISWVSGIIGLIGSIASIISFFS
ncbi:hypothetical protein [Blautia marasmi]|uniref:hypothetical protein n=1 Tax=Blautia marasmi TaxID=1917868 RepID=UPI000CF20CB0|nr:hypothetical protein [Blautia marasmi]